VWQSVGAPPVEDVVRQINGFGEVQHVVLQEARDVQDLDFVPAAAT
jgi:hypothetical protein